jgi:BirA family biotin operon repressor/biotin-[acetyl-CoA-carboxylase] ligase
MFNPPNLPKGYDLIFFDSIGSTNEELKKMAITHNAPGGLVMWSLAQTGGKGRLKRNWVSKRGNMHCSVLFRPDYGIVEAAQIGFLTVVAAGESLTALLGKGVSLSYKWPNDLLLNEKKIGGILLESNIGQNSTGSWVVVGCGINLQNFPQKTRFPATSIIEELGESLIVKNVVEAFLTHLEKWYRCWREYGFMPVRDAWLSSAHSIGEPLIIISGSEKILGSFEDLDEDGALVIKTQSGTRRISAGDIYFSPANGGL